MYFVSRRSKCMARTGPYYNGIMIPNGGVAWVLKLVGQNLIICPECPDVATPLVPYKIPKYSINLAC